jgi:hypothetical protein
MVNAESECPSCGASMTPNYVDSNRYPKEEDKVNVGFCILAVLIPIFGIIFWAIKRNETPRSAKLYGTIGLISWIASFVIGVALGVVLGLMEAMLMYM